MTMKIDMAPNLKLPEDAVTQKFAFLGISGSGKTYAAGKFVEELIGIHAQVVVLDVIGNWWGLRAGADGKSKGLPVYVFGGRHGDVPLEPTGGTLAADVIADHGSSVVLDVSEFTGGELRHFVTDFALRLLKRKKDRPSPLMIVWEECQDVVPQHVMRDQAKMVGAVEKLVKQGRNYGVGTTLISQRPQAVNKDVLNQVETIFVFRTVGKQERHAIKAWMTEKAVDLDLVEELPTIETGTAYVWSPGWLRWFGSSRISKKKTFDASSTPKFGTKAETRELAVVDLDAISSAMAATIQRAKENDPSALKRRIAELERQLASAPTAAKVEYVEVKVPDANAIHSLEVLVIEELRTVERKVKEASVLIMASQNGTARAIQAAAARGETSAERRDRLKTSLQPVKLEELAKKPDAPFRAPGVSSKPNGLRKGAVEMLSALAQMRPRPLTRTQIATLSGLSPTSGTFSTYMSDLRKSSLIMESGDRVEITKDGLAVVPDVDPTPPSTEALVDLWSKKLRSGTRKMLDHLVLVFPSTMPRSELAEAAGLSPTSGTFSTYLSDLRRNGLLEEDGGEVSASRTLFPTKVLN